MCRKELLAAMGFPAFPEHAAKLGLPVMDNLDVEACSALLGNSMHLACCAVMELVALASVAFVQQHPT